MIPSIKRVVSSFILSGAGTATIKRDNDLQIAVFHRVDTMPTFPGHWAPCSGSIEEDETPWETAQRELHEETNLPANVEPNRPCGLFLDVPFRKDRIIRVYPFTVTLPPNHTLELLGTEHDTYKFVNVSELEELKPAVPGLAQAFHHATYGAYKKDVTPEMRKWAANRSSGAADMAQNAVRLVQEHHGKIDPNNLRLMRPSMVAITNALDKLIEARRHDNSMKEDDVDGGSDSCVSPDQVLASLQTASQQSVEHAVERILPLIQDYQADAVKSTKNRPFCIATHSRSSTVLSVLQRLLQSTYDNSIRILCGMSTPGEEGKIMVQDLGGDAVAECVPDDVLLLERMDEVDLLLVGCDCLTEHDVVNKVGTLALAQRVRAQEASHKKTKLYCCVDRWKLWKDFFPPPLEDIFECVPRHLFDEILLPPVPSEG